MGRRKERNNRDLHRDAILSVAKLLGGGILPSDLEYCPEVEGADLWVSPRERFGVFSRLRRLVPVSDDDFEASPYFDRYRYEFTIRILNGGGKRPSEMELIRSGVGKYMLYGEVDNRKEVLKVLRFFLINLDVFRAFPYRGTRFRAPGGSIGESFSIPAMDPLILTASSESVRFRPMQKSFLGEYVLRP